MAEELQTAQPPAERPLSKRKLKPRKGKKPNKRLRPLNGATYKTPKPSNKMKKLFRKRVRDYNSDDEEEDDDEDSEGDDLESKDDEEQRDEDAEGSDGDGGGDRVRRGASRLPELSYKFKVAFTKIMSKKLPKKDPLGPILSSNKKLVAEKLAEEEGDHKAKAAAKKEKHLAQEKGHVKPANYLDAKEKSLVSVATKGVVKLFNAVNKAQNPQKGGLDPRKSKDAKVLAKRRKQTFLSELKKPTSEAAGNRPSFGTSKAHGSADSEDDDEPGWAPLRDGYMLTNPKLKNWDKMADSTMDDYGKAPAESSSDEE